jgi:serine/threonine protein kinase
MGEEPRKPSEIPTLAPPAPLHDTLDSAREGATSRPGTPFGEGLYQGVVIAERYRLDTKLGEGGMGIVWEATHLVTRRSVALKFLKPEGPDPENARARFLRETSEAATERLAQLHCP